MTEDVEDPVVAKVSDYLDGLLTGAERDDVAAKIQTDETWKRTHDELVEARKYLSGMRKAKAPDTFAHEVEQTIHKRSAGAFFGRRTLGDRVPFGVLLIVALLALAVVGYFMWSSPTGSLKVDKKTTPTEKPSVSAPRP